MEHNAAYTALKMIAGHFGDWAGYVWPSRLQANVAGMDFDQQAEVIVNGLRVTAHSQSGKEWPVYVQVYTNTPVPVITGNYTLASLKLVFDDIARYANIPR